MKQDYRSALALAFNRGRLEAPSDGACLLFNACDLHDLDREIKEMLICEQGFRPQYLDLEKAGTQVEAVFSDIKPSLMAIVLVGRNRKINQQNIIRAWNAVQEGGQIIVAGDKTSGAASLRKWVKGKTEIENSFSKHHALVFWFTKQGDGWIEQSLTINTDGYEISEGMFSSDGPDKGSKLLARHFDTRIKNRVADFGAGWGYLSKELIEQSGQIKSINLYEADYRSLEAAKHNLSTIQDVDLTFHWCDLMSEFKKQVFDWVIMNPPFHSDRAAEPGLGKRFIQTAASTLPSGGRLLMVANVNLPYEQVLDDCFKAFNVLETADGFKVLEARK